MKMETVINTALVLNLNRKHMHLFGLTPLHFYKPKIEYIKFLALVKILKSIIKDEDGFQWIKVPENNYADFIGFNITKIRKGGYKFYTKYATELKHSEKTV